MTKLVLDASASVDLLLETRSGKALQNQLPAGATWYVPEHFYVEVAGAIRRAAIGGHITEARATIAIDDLLATPIKRAQVSPLLREAWKRRGHLTVADAIYIVLAEALDATLVTTDIKLAGSPGLTVDVLSP